MRSTLTLACLLLAFALGACRAESPCICPPDGAAGGPATTTGPAAGVPAAAPAAGVPAAAPAAAPAAGVPAAAPAAGVPAAGVPAAAPAVPVAVVAAPAPPEGTWEPAIGVMPDSPRAQLGLEVAENLFNARFAEVSAHFNGALRSNLTDDRLAGVLEGVVRVHGSPVRVLDAWDTTIRENEVEMQAVAVHLKMSASTTRFKLLLVFDVRGALDGLWLRPA